MPHPHSPSGRESMKLLHCLVLFSLHSTAGASEDGHWCYLSQKCHDQQCKEPRQWGQLYPECTSSEQSPINIVTSKVKYDWNLTPFRFKNHNTNPECKWKVENNGHTVIVHLDGSSTIELGGLEGKYKAVQFHFHWGNDEKGSPSTRISPGSEHSIDGERYAMELHIVHIKEEFASVADAIKGKGVAVLGFFIEVGKTNEYYEPFISKLKEIPYPGNKTEMSAVCLDSLIPKAEDLTQFYRYTGSLTTPECSENVIWTLFEKPIQLGLEQIQEFWMKLYFGDNKDWWMVDNFRPVQPVGDREILKSDSDTLMPPAKASLLIPTAAYLALSLIQ
ncbi:carbonic anhydrase 4 [Elgaria multicarinata webbii]|uniref:carbonic anhydrase 4 n=1 Tax=Elgaria multicarinata webbii TaxID=159646 RepID=UPI002FCD6859